MKIFRNIYGVYGMVEWSTLIPTGGSNLRVDFTNGSICSRGIDPATFTTDAPGVQAAIENSPKYKSGKIKKIKSFVIGEIADEVIPVKEDPEVKSAVKRGAKSVETSTGAANAGEAGNNNGGGDNNGASDAGNDNLGANGEVTGVNGGDADEDNKFSDVKNSQQAKAILMREPYNVPLADLGNKQAILDKASELNVVFSNWK